MCGKVNPGAATLIKIMRMLYEPRHVCDSGGISEAN